MRALAGLVLASTACLAATFGTVVPVVGGASDLALDEARGRLYLVNSNTNRIEVYSVPQRRFLNPISVENQPLAVAMSRNGKALYVTCHLGNSLNIIDLDTQAVINRIGLPARPEGVAVGADERVLISTVGTGQGNQFNVLLIYDPFAPAGAQAVSAVPVSPPPPANPLLPPNNFGRSGLTNRSYLQASPDGQIIVGVNIPNTTAESVFVYESASGNVLRSRLVTGVSSVLSISPDGKKFMAGLNLFDTASLTVIARQNTANAPYPFPTGTNFNLQQNQGGSTFSSDGSRIYSAFNFTPVTNPPSRPNVSQLMINDPDNLLIQTALQMPENIAGKMVIASDSSNLFALSESGFIVVPLSDLSRNPIAMPEVTSVLVANDQCGVTSDQRTVRIPIRNDGQGRIQASVALLQQPNAIAGLGGAGGPGGGAPGGLPIIVIPGFGGGPGGFAGGPGNQQANNQAGNITATAPRTRTVAQGDSVALEFTYNPANRGLGTVSPVHQYVVQSDQAINIPPAVQVFQNNRNTEARGDVFPIDVALTNAEGLVDMVQDNTRQMLYIANSGKNRVEVFDMRRNKMMDSIKVGQLPRSLALSLDGSTLYVANSGGEAISIVDVQTRTTVGSVRFPAVPFNGNVALVTPQVITMTQRGPLVLMNNGTLWRIIGDEAVPRRFNTSVIPANAQGVQTLTQPWTMAASPNGEVALVLAGNGNAYLYDASLDDFVQSRTVVSNPINGYYGPVSVGPRGQYFLVNGFVLNQSLTQIATAGTVAAQQPVRPGQPLPAPGGATAGGATQNRTVASVAPIGLTSFARFVPPAVANANVFLTIQDTPSIEIVDVTSGRTLRTASALDRPLSNPTGNQRANVPGRTMAIDAAGTTAYVLTASGLSVVPIDVQPAQNRPTISQNGVVSTVSLQASTGQGSLLSIFGRSLASSASVSSTPWPTVLGGVCVTVNNVPVPLVMTSAEQINAQIPVDLAPNRYVVMVRGTDSKVASQSAQVQVAKYAPAVLFDTKTNQISVFHEDGTPVTKDNPAKRDRPLVMYASGLGPTKPVAKTGEASPANAATDKVQVFFGDPRYNGAEIIVDSSELLQGSVGIYKLELRVPGDHLRGQALPVTLKIGTATSPTTGPVVPVIAVD
ncbi:MAG: hypothetical protein U0Q16_25250 [Bryobacteraceae bacterium]